MISQRKRTVLWSPFQPEKFLVAGNELQLFQVQYSRQPQNVPAEILDPFASNQQDDLTLLPHSQRKTFKQLDLISDSTNQFRCVSWSMDKNEPNMIGVGTFSGKATLMRFHSQHRVVKEFSPKYPRPCNVVSFNPVQPNQLAMGLDKVRNDYCTLIFDVNQVGSSQTGGPAPVTPSSSSFSSSASSGGFVTSSVSPHHHHHHDEDTPLVAASATATTSASGKSVEVVYRPLHKLSNNEAVTSMDWLTEFPNVLVVGTGFKWLRLYDVRSSHSSSTSSSSSSSSSSTLSSSSSSSSSSQPVSVIAHPRAVQSVCVDPFYGWRIASSSEDGIVKFWDVRMLTEAFYTLDTKCKSIQQMAWCPTRRGLMAISAKGESSIRLYDISEPLHIDVSHLSASASSTMISSSISNMPFSAPPVPSASSHQSPQPSSSSTSSFSISASASSSTSAALAASNTLALLKRYTSLTALPMPSSPAIPSASQLSTIPSSFTPEPREQPYRSRVTPSAPTALAWHPQSDQRLLVLLSSAIVGSVASSSASASTSFTSSSVSSLIASSSAVVSSSSTTPSSGSEVASLLQDISLHDSIPLAWSASNGIGFVSSMNLFISSEQSFTLPDLECDVSQLMHQRALQGYGFALEKNSYIAKSQAHALSQLLSSLSASLSLSSSRLSLTISEAIHHALNLNKFWKHFEHAKHLAQSEFAPLASVFSTLSPFPGVNGIISAVKASSSTSSSIHDSNIPASEGKQLTCFEIFTSQARQMALRLCGWSSSIESVLLELENEGEFARAAALALFSLDLDRAVQALTKASDSHQSDASNFSLVAMALAGFPDNDAPDSFTRKRWLKTCDSVRHLVTHPYLKAAFAFLCADGVSTTASIQSSHEQQHRFPDVLNAGMDLIDRVAFGLRFLPDHELKPLIQRWTDEAVSAGDLHGIVLTGVSTLEGIELIQSYIDSTSDVQLASIVISHIHFPSLSNEMTVLTSRADRWLSSYRQLLDAWKLWHERARFDTSRALLINQWVSQIYQTSTSSPQVHISPQVFARCQYCGSSLSLPKLMDPSSARRSSSSVVSSTLSSSSATALPPRAGGGGLGAARAAAGGGLGAARAAGLGASRMQALGLSSSAATSAESSSAVAPSSSVSSPSASSSSTSPYSISKSRVTSCPTCKKPLPHCALCLLPMTCAPPTMAAAAAASSRASRLSSASSDSPNSMQTPIDSSVDRKSSYVFSQWFTWCQSCRHGGHSNHMSEWFATHTDCPVTDCKCECGKFVIPSLQ